MGHCQTVLSTISEPSRRGEIAATTHAQLGKRSNYKFPTVPEKNSSGCEDPAVSVFLLSESQDGCRSGEQ